jgi:hypothetical protein
MFKFKKSYDLEKNSFKKYLVENGNTNEKMIRQKDFT